MHYHRIEELENGYRKAKRDVEQTRTKYNEARKVIHLLETEEQRLDLLQYYHSIWLTAVTKCNKYRQHLLNAWAYYNKTIIEK